MDEERAKALDTMARDIVNSLIFYIGKTNVERSYLTSKVQEFTIEKERSTQ